MIIVADTSPINYLILLGHIQVLPRLYERVLIPRAVKRELLDSASPAAVQEWMRNLPAWIETISVRGKSDVALSALDMGEAEAIQLARDLHVSDIIVDEAVGRRVALQSGLRVIGTLGVLKNAAEQNLLDLPDAVERLMGLKFRVAQSVVDDILKSR